MVLKVKKKHSRYNLADIFWTVFLECFLENITFLATRLQIIVLIKFVYARLILNLNLIFHEKTVATKTRNLPEVTIIYQENSDLLIYLFISTVLSIEQALF